MRDRIARFAGADAGQGLVETALLLTLVAIVCVLALTQTGQDLAPRYQQAADSFPN